MTDAAGATSSDRSPAWALPLVALGLCLVACGVLIPAAEANRQVEAERRELAAELRALEERAAMNDDFLGRLHHDAALVERLARRQRPPAFDEGVAALAADATTSAADRAGLTPFAMLRPEPVEAEPAPEPAGGVLAAWCRDGRGRLGVVGAGLMGALLALLAGGAKAAGDDPVPSAA